MKAATVGKIGTIWLGSMILGVSTIGSAGVPLSILLAGGYGAAKYFSGGEDE